MSIIGLPTKDHLFTGDALGGEIVEQASRQVTKSRSETESVRILFDLLRHRPVATAQPGFDMRDGQVHLGRRQRGRQG